MKTIFQYRSGLEILAWCMIAVLINSMLFELTNGYPRHPVLPIRKIGLPINIIGFLVGWIAFAYGSYQGLPRKIGAIFLISIINFFMVCNLWNVLFLNG